MTQTLNYRGPDSRIQVNELAIESLGFAYGSRSVLNAISFKANAGERIAIVGPNGCGKSTLLRLIVGELTPAAGRITIDGAETRAIGRLGLARRLSLVPQMTEAPFGYTVREMVLMSRHAAIGEARKNDETKIENGGGRKSKIENFLASGFWLLASSRSFETADDLQLANEAMWNADVHHLADRPINELSGGERQRVAIARAFTQNTPIMLLDEPTSSLDLFHQLELMEQLHQMTREEGGERIALLVTHDLNLAADHATRVIVMDAGQILADGPTSQVLVPAVLEPIYRVKIERTPDGTLHFKRNVSI
ncbi:MAG: ABC transporter ATP-binding protein [Phycisphaerales bacterium]|nr:ABC transporter ATP-binding protein [Phycisphaerales bacterium]